MPEDKAVEAGGAGRELHLEDDPWSRTFEYRNYVASAASEFFQELNSEPDARKR
jgi:hypothetical protein